MNDTARPLAPTTAALPAPWGFWTSSGWGLLSIGLWLAVNLLAVMVGLVLTYGSDVARLPQAPRFEHMALVSAIAIIAAAPLQVGLLAIAARAARWRVADYFALTPPSRGQIIFGFCVLALVLIASDAVNYLLGRDIVPEFMIDLYRNGRDHGGLVLLLIAIILAAPIAEEITFRGFLFRGWSQSWLGIWGTILLTSLAWTALHVQYDWLGMLQVFLLGILFGWLRWASGSTRLTILLHIVTNAAATAQAVIKVEWMS